MSKAKVHRSVPSRSSLYHRAGLIVLLVAAVVRLTAVGLGLNELRSDPDSYARLSVNLAEQDVFGFEDRSSQTSGTETDTLAAIHPTAYRPPVYPWVLSWLVSDGQLQIWAVAILHATLGIASVLLCFVLAKRIGAVAWIAALGFALDPILLRQSQLVMTETWVTFLALLIWLCWLELLELHHAAEDSSWGIWLTSASCLGLGLLFGVAILTRPPMAIWALLCGLCLHLSLRPKQRSDIGNLLQVKSSFGVSSLSSFVLFALGITCCVLPWMLRNQRLLGKPLWATTHGGYTLLLANNPLLYEHFQRNGPSRGWDAEPFHRAWASRDQNQRSPTELDFWTREALLTSPVGRNELQDDALAYAAAKATIAREPGIFLLASIYRVGWLWAIWPYSEQISSVAVLIAVWYLFWYSLAVYQICLLLRRLMKCRPRDLVWQIARWPLLPGILLVMSLTAVHAVYWSNMRMRAPMMCVVYLLAARKPTAERFPRQIISDYE